ncbi:MAG: hypothetical protein NC908_04710 [Candidatus Omnitrophica bacterium]|nr:hypothetical protein [Candidatus Omnitrophota bacterium]
MLNLSPPDPGLSPKISQSSDKKLGGIDFRDLPIVAKAIDNIKMDITSSTINKLASLDPNQQWQQIQSMLNSKITPPAQNLKEFIQTACLKDALDINKVLICLLDILRQQEETCQPTEPILKDILTVLEIINSPEELKAVLVGS